MSSPRHTAKALFVIGFSLLGSHAQAQGGRGLRASRAPASVSAEKDPFENEFRNFIARLEPRMDLSEGDQICASMSLIKVLKNSSAISVKGENPSRRHRVYSARIDRLLSALGLVAAQMESQNAPVMKGYLSWDDFKAQKIVVLMKDIRDPAFARCAISSDDAIHKCSAAYQSDIMDFDRCIETRLGQRSLPRSSLRL